MKRKQVFNITFEAPKGKRVHRYFWAVTQKTRTGYYWSEDDKKWMLDDDIKGTASTHADCRTIRAFKRMLRKNPILIGNCVLVSRYWGCDVCG